MKYVDLGKLIKSEREKRGWGQADLAKRMRVTQQTISRWEKGGSRPRQDDLLQLVTLFSGDNYVWFSKAGYDFEEPDTSLSPYLPVQNLSPANFELFCRDLIQALNPNADVYRYGTQGSIQYGVDLIAKRSSVVFDYQCKRHKQFGPKKISTAVKKTKLTANRHYLLLSRTATSLARKEIDRHQKWTLWDREDISAQVRQIPRGVAIQLVDTYFPGKRKSFLGVDDPSPWLTTEKFFQPFVDRQRPFSHGWDFIGHTKELEQLKEFEDQSGSQVIILKGRGGSGKSRLLREWAINTRDKNIHFLSAGSDVNAASLEYLPTGPSFLVIDDAHDRTDVLAILNGIARTRPEMKVILSTRPYGIERLRDDILKSGLPYEYEVLALSELTLENAKMLAEQVLADTGVNGDIEYARRIAEITKDCPFATIIGSRLVGEGKIRPQQLKNERQFRYALLGKFRDVITGDIGEANRDEIRDTLDFLALIQPFLPSDPVFQRSAANVLNKPTDKVIRTISLLEDAGVLLRRGDRLRITPDLLADYIRASAAYNEKDQRPTGYADRIFGVVQGELATNLLVNISQLDWRLSTDGIQSSLLEEIWSSLKAQFIQAKIYERVAILDVITKISYYYAGPALDFVKLALSQPTDEVEPGPTWIKPSYQLVLEKIPSILRYIAYDRNQLTDTLNILKELAEKDIRSSNQYPDHPIRVLQEIASIEPYKPLSYNECVANHVIGWLAQPSINTFSPFDVLDVMLATEGQQSESHGFAITLKPFQVKPEVVFGLRQHITNEAINIINNRPYNETVRVLKTLSAALSYPHGILGQPITLENKEAWDPSIVSVLDGLLNVVTNPKIDPFITAEIWKMVSWPVKFGSEKVKVAANKVVRAVPKTLYYEVSRALLDPWGMSFILGEDNKYEDIQANSAQWRSKIASDLLQEYKERLPELIRFLEDRAFTLNSAKMTENTGVGVFLDNLMETSSEFADYLGNHILANPLSPLASWFGILVTRIARQDYIRSLDLAQKTLNIGEQILIRGLAWALGIGEQNLEATPAEIEIIRNLALSSDPFVRHCVINASKRFPKESESTTLDILLSVDVSDSAELTDDLFSTFNDNFGKFKIENLNDEQLTKVLRHLVICPSLDNYFINLFLRDLSFRHPLLTLKMLMDRIENLENNQALKNYNPLPSPFRPSESLRFSETDHYEQVLKMVRDWATIPTGNWKRFYYGKDLFKLITSGFDDITINVLQEWIMSSNNQQFENAASLLQEAPRSFVWDKQTFVINLLDQAQNYGSDCYSHVSSSLSASVIQGARSGTPGQPFPEDIEQRDRSFEILSKLPLGSPAYRFYKMLYGEAMANIKRDTYDESELE